MKISSFMISIALAALFTSLFASYYAAIDDQYAVTINENTSGAINALNKFQEIQATTQTINQTLFDSDDGDSGVTDIIGKFLGAGFNVLKLAKESFSAFYSILETSMTNLGLPGYFLDILATIALIIILFIIISALVGKDV